MASDSFCTACGATNRSTSKFCAVCGHALDTTTTRAGASPAATGLLNQTTILQQRYQIMHKIGQGGFGAVYQARDLRLQSALRAIKEMSQGQLSAQERQEAIAAFQQEAALLAGLMHPNLPRIYDHFEEQQRWYLVMDFIEGQTLEAVLTGSPQGKIAVEQVIAYAVQLCTVLHYLHSQTPPIIFRDLKPANIMVTPDEHLYLIDFGIARLFKPGQAKDTIALGSPGYAAPEQYGKAQTTVRADIYSLGATLHQLLCGRDPSDDPFTFPPLHLEPQGPRTIALTELVMRMVAIDREKRPANIAEVKQALQDLPSKTPTTPQPPANTPVISTSVTQGIKPDMAFEWHKEAVTSLAWSPDSRWIASGSGKQLIVWDALTGNIHSSQYMNVKNVSWSRDDQLIILDGSHLMEGSAFSNTFTEVSALVIGGNSMALIDCFACSPNGRYLAFVQDNPGGYNQHVVIQDRIQRKVIRAYPTKSHNLASSISLSPDNRYLLVTFAYQQASLLIWDNTSAQDEPIFSPPISSPKVRPVSYREAVWSPDGRYLTVRGSGGWEIWDGSTFSKVSVPDLASYGSIDALSWYPRGRFLAVATNAIVSIWDSEIGQQIGSYQGLPEDKNPTYDVLAWSPDGTCLAAGSQGAYAYVWQVQFPDPLPQFPLPPIPPYAPQAPQNSKQAAQSRRSWWRKK